MRMLTGRYGTVRAARPDVVREDPHVLFDRLQFFRKSSVRLHSPNDFGHCEGQIVQQKEQKQLSQPFESHQFRRFAALKDSQLPWCVILELKSLHLYGVPNSTVQQLLVSTDFSHFLRQQTSVEATAIPLNSV